MSGVRSDFSLIPVPNVAWWALTRRWPRDLNPRLTSGYAARPTDVDGWFELHLPSLQLRVSGTIPVEFRERAEYVLDRLHQRDDERVMRQRTAWYSLFQCGELSRDGLEKIAPLIAAAIAKE